MGAGSGVGVATVLDASKPQFILVRTVGATYLIFPGCSGYLETLGRDGVVLALKGIRPSATMSGPRPPDGPAGSVGQAARCPAEESR
jgi:hypothetical protein